MPKTPSLSFLPTGIRLHKTGKFIVDITIKGNRITKTFEKLEDAILWRTEAKQRGIETTKEVIKLWTIKEACDAVKASRWNHTLSPQTPAANAACAVEFFGADCLLKDINQERIDSYVEYLRSIGNSNATINKKLTIIHVLITEAEERGRYGATKMPKMPRQKPRDHRIRFISPEEEHDLLQAMRARGFRDQADAVLVLLYTGFRCGELWKLEVRDVDLVNNVITTWETKTGRSRSVPIVPCIRDVLKAHCEGKKDRDNVFPGSCRQWIKYCWTVCKKDIGLADDEQFVPHMLRHSCATRLSQQGVSLPVIKNWLGHSCITTTMRYAHFNQKDMFAAMELLNATRED